MFLGHKVGENSEYCTGLSKRNEAKLRESFCLAAASNFSGQSKGLGEIAIPWLLDSCMQAQAEEISNSGKKKSQTWKQQLCQALYSGTKISYHTEYGSQSDCLHPVHTFDHSTSPPASPDTTFPAQWYVASFFKVIESF